MQRKVLQSLLTLTLVLLLAGTASAQERLQVKQLAGPIDEVRTGVMAEVAPIESGIHSKSALIPVELSPDKSGVYRWDGQIAIDGNNLDLVLFAGDDSWPVQLSRPGARGGAAAHKMATTIERSSLDMGGSSFEGDVYKFAEVEPGAWNVSVSADAPRVDKGFLLVSSDSAYHQLSYKANRDQLVGNRIDFVSYGYEKTLEGPQTEANLGIVHEAWLRVTLPGGEVIERSMFDDGLHGDGAAGDGIFGGSFLAQRAGHHHAQVVVRGTTPEGLPFLRTSQHLVPVIERPMELALDFATSTVVDAKRLAVSLAVDNFEDAPDKYRVLAEVWGAGPRGEMQPISWIGGMSYVDGGQLELGLDLRWIGLSGTDGPFELRNVRIEDPDTFILVAKVERMDLVTPTLPSLAHAAPKSLDDEMLMGPRPRATTHEKAGRLLLVHGYCSGDAWGPVAGQFSNDSRFLDLNQNRSHDQFAVLLGTFGNNWSSFGVVAHSQGGAASLHLYTYYWSGLDYASAGRLIQSVGTPYQGTALAGNAAVLGQIFGAGCGSNTDLTYSGASSWLSGIPSWARGKVNYYTTSFTDKWWRYDYCHLVTDLLLSDPDDGTTEKSKGQLSGAINRGHKTGWCHTTGMRDAPQVQDSGRNSTMNSNAAN